MTDRLRWNEPAERRVRPLILEPARFAYVLGAVLTLVGMLTPWATGIDQARQPVSFSPLMDAEGVLFVLLSVAAPLSALSRSVAESRTRTLQASAAVIGAVAVINWLTAWRMGAPVSYGGARVLWVHEREPGLYVAAAGVALLAIGGLAISLRAWRRNGTMSDPLDVIVTRQSVLAVVLQIVLGLAAFIAGLYVPLAAFGPTAILVMTLGALGAGAIGLEAGDRIAARALRRAPGRRTRVRSRAWTDNAPRF